MTVGGEFRGNFNVYYAGDADSTDNEDLVNQIILQMIVTG